MSSTRQLSPERLERALRRARARAAVRQLCGPSPVLRASFRVVPQWCLGCAEPLLASSCDCDAPTPTTINPATRAGQLWSHEESP